MDLHKLTPEVLENAGWTRFFKRVGRKVRPLNEPNKPMETIQGYIRMVIEEILRPSAIAQGCRPESSPLKNALVHRGNRYFYQLDLANAYPRTRVGWLITAYRQARGRQFTPQLFPPGDGQTQMGFEDDPEQQLREFFSRYCFEDQGRKLVQGGPASPFIFELVASYRIDWRLAGLCAAEGITYTRYADDLTFSSKRPITPRQRREIHHMIRQSGFRVQDYKSKRRDIQRTTVEITGVVLHADGRVALPREFLKRAAFVMATTARIIEDGRDPKLPKRPGSRKLKDPDLVVGGLWAHFKSITGYEDRPLNRHEKNVVRCYWQYQAARKKQREAFARLSPQERQLALDL